MALPDEGFFRQNDYFRGNDGKWYLYEERNKGFTDVRNGKPAGDNSNFREFPPDVIPENLRIDKSADVIENREDKFVIGSVSAGKLTDSSGIGLKYPNQMIEDNTDYVIFQFAKYVPPFGKSGEGGGNMLDNYNASISNKNFKSTPVTVSKSEFFNKNPKDGESATQEIKSIILPMPQDLSTEQKQDWQSKSFTRLGAAAIAALGGGSFSKADAMARNVGGNLKAIKDAITTSGLNAIPGVGGNLSFNDITGSTRGVILNPNAELLYDGPSIREIGMVFKMVPMNRDETNTIKSICDAFRTASLPIFAGEGSIDISDLKNQKTDTLADSNFIRVPLLCKFTFMKGGDRHPFVAQYKPCGIASVEINYTPDGTYATYENGSPVATEISLKFVETKLIFASEIAAGF
jgi:hypothetical protein|tara:strand:- start:817 stop:2031 length:1215 start_codon:yes stop_codon:yes gene_type:complete